MLLHHLISYLILVFWLFLNSARYSADPTPPAECHKLLSTPSKGPFLVRIAERAHSGIDRHGRHNGHFQTESRIPTGIQIVQIRVMNQIRRVAEIAATPRRSAAVSAACLFAAFSKQLSKPGRCRAEELARRMCPPTAFLSFFFRSCELQRV